MDLAEFRAQFDILGTDAWLATPSGAPAARSVLAAMREVLGSWDGGEPPGPGGFPLADTTRAHLARLTGRTTAEVSLHHSTAEGVATVAASLSDGARVVLGEGEYRSNALPWLAHAHRGVTATLVPMNRGCLHTDDLLAAITEEMTLVAVSDVQSASGSRVDLAAVSRRCEETGTQLFVDATQSLGVIPFPGEVRADHVVTHGYKWLLGSRGAAWLVSAPERIPQLRPLAANPRTDGTGAMYGAHLDVAPDARRLDTAVNWPGWVFAAAGLDLLTQLSPEAVAERALGLAARAREGLTDLGLEVLPTDLPSHIVGVRTDRADELVIALRERGVHVTARAGTLRLGFHGFNDDSDLDRALQGIAAALSR